VRVVLDTNVVLSGVFFGGVPGEILAAWSRGRLDVVVSAPILAEYGSTVVPVCRFLDEVLGA